MFFAVSKCFMLALSVVVHLCLCVFVHGVQTIGQKGKRPGYSRQHCPEDKCHGFVDFLKRQSLHVTIDLQQSVRDEPHPFFYNKTARQSTTASHQPIAHLLTNSLVSRSLCISDSMRLVVTIIILSSGHLRLVSHDDIHCR